MHKSCRFGGSDGASTIHRSHLQRSHAPAFSLAYTFIHYFLIVGQEKWYAFCFRQDFTFYSQADNTLQNTCSTSLNCTDGVSSIKQTTWSGLGLQTLEPSQNRLGRIYFISRASSLCQDASQTPNSMTSGSY